MLSKSKVGRRLMWRIPPPPPMLVKTKLQLYAGVTRVNILN